MGSIALDVRDNLMLVMARWYYCGLVHNLYLPSSGLYEHLLGVVHEANGPNSSAQAVRFIEGACTSVCGILP